MSDFKKIMQFANMLKELEWTDIEILNLPEEYTNTMVHLAIEKADNKKDKKSFDLILNGDGKLRKQLLLKHIEKTKPCYIWNYA